jgi:hypothetical protein
MYIYQADVYCDSCGNAIEEELRAAGYTDTGDSDDFPQGGYPETEETDSPQHCASREQCLEAIDLSAYGLAENAQLIGAETRFIGALLGNSLTEEGASYLKEQLNEKPWLGSALHPRTEYQTALFNLWREEFADYLPAALESFELEIELGNESMQTAEDVALALRNVAYGLEAGKTEGRVTDINGNTVGAWNIS